MSRETQSVLVVVEGSAACPLWMSHWGAAPTGDWSMVEQEEWESAAAFGDRLSGILERCTMSDPETVIVFVAGARTDDAAMATRWGTSTTLLAHLSQIGGGNLVLTRGYGHDGRPEPMLAALAADLAEEWDGSGVTVTVKLAEAPRTSQMPKTGLSRTSHRPYDGQAFAQPA
jgi:hypothetical protein